MKVRITGHTRGLGKSLYNQFKALGHDVKGYSLSTGYDINSQEDRQKIIADCKDADVFINNVHYGFVQVKLLRSAFTYWQKKNKVIINMSSTTADKSKDGVLGRKIDPKIIINSTSKRKLI